MKIDEITSMSELAATLDDVEEYLAQLDHAEIQPLDTSTVIKTTWQGKPLSVKYQLKTMDAAEHRRQLTAALRSHTGRQPLATDSVQQLLNGVTVRKHALRFITTPTRYAISSITLAGQQLPLRKKHRGDQE